MLVLEVRNGMVGSRHCTASEWDEFYNFVLANGSSTLSITQGHFTKRPTQAASSSTSNSTPNLSSSSSTTSSSSSSSSSNVLITKDLLEAIKRRIAAFVDASGSALMTTVGGICEAKDVCSREQWLAFTATIDRDNHIDDIYLVRVSAKTQTWRLAVRSTPDHQQKVQQPITSSTPIPASPQQTTQQPPLTATQPSAASSSQSSSTSRSVFVDSVTVAVDAIGYLLAKPAVAIDCEGIACSLWPSRRIAIYNEVIRKGNLDQNEQFFLRLVQSTALFWLMHI